MRRREVIAICLGTPFIYPFAARAQLANKQFRVGLISPAERNSTRLFDSFRQKLHELGYHEGQNLVIEYRFTAGDFSRAPQMLSELVGLPVDVIVTDGGIRFAQAAREASQTIPIVMAVGPSDPVAAGLAENFARPGGNVTGFTIAAAELSGKRLEVLKQAYPQVTHVAAIWDPNSGAQNLRGAQDAAAALSIELHQIDIANPDEIASKIEKGVQDNLDAIDVLSSGMFWNQRAQVIAALAKHRLPIIYPEPDWAFDGGLLAYGPDVSENFRGAAIYVDKILKGAKPGELPIVQPAKFSLVLNLKTAKAQGLTIPPSLMMRADELIE